MYLAYKFDRHRRIVAVARNRVLHCTLPLTEQYSIMKIERLQISLMEFVMAVQSSCESRSNEVVLEKASNPPHAFLSILTFCRWL